MLVKYSTDQVARVFKRFAELECKGKSALYYQLALQVAEDQALLQLASECRERQPIPNLLLGAVHYLLLQKKEEKLAAYYPSISGQNSKEIPYALFRAFCFEHEDEIQQVLQNRIVQTNAVNRAVINSKIL